MKTIPAYAPPPNGLDITATDGPAKPSDLSDCDLERVTGGTGPDDIENCYLGGVRRAAEDTEGDGLGLVVVDPGGTPVVRTRLFGGDG